MSNNRFRKKPVEVEAILYEANKPIDVINFIGSYWLISYDGNEIFFKNLEGSQQSVNPGEWVLRGYSESAGSYVWAVKQGYLDEFYEPIE